MAETVSTPNHVFDLPQTYQKPSASSLFQALELLAFGPSSFDMNLSAPQPQISSEGVPKYLTSIIASDLHWIDNEDDREALWDLASRRLTERSGRTGMSNITRKFTVPTAKGSVDIQLKEPALTGDNLGLKTWASSYVLAKRLYEIDLSMSTMKKLKCSSETPTVLELGAGTGLVGISAALVWEVQIVLTDLPEIEPNLFANIEHNYDLLESNETKAFCGVLDWTNPKVIETRSSGGTAPAFNLSDALVVLAADPIYSPEHPAWLVQTVTTWLKRDRDARFILAYPTREAYVEQIQHLKHLLDQNGLVAIDEQSERARDDWAEDIIVSWSIWTWKEHESRTL